MNENFKIAVALTGLIILCAFLFVAPTKAHAQGMIGVNVDGTAILAPSGSNSIYIEQIGNYNSITVNQDSAALVSRAVGRHRGELGHGCCGVAVVVG